MSSQQTMLMDPHLILFPEKLDNGEHISLIKQ